ncbi:MAG: hypothetical protein HQL54_02930 [Magnetococcales bacterium]|nr:hypothetical protein [Magnetococcales bacterium]
MGIAQATSYLINQAVRTATELSQHSREDARNARAVHRGMKENTDAKKVDINSVTRKNPAYRVSLSMAAVRQAQTAS